MRRHSSVLRTGTWTNPCLDLHSRICVRLVFLPLVRERYRLLPLAFQDQPCRDYCRLLVSTERHLAAATRITNAVCQGNRGYGRVAPCSESRVYLLGENPKHSDYGVQRRCVFFMCPARLEFRAHGAGNSGGFGQGAPIKTASSVKRSYCDRMLYLSS